MSILNSPNASKMDQEKQTFTQVKPKGRKIPLISPQSGGNLKSLKYILLDFTILYDMRTSRDFENFVPLTVHVLTI